MRRPFRADLDDRVRLVMHIVHRYEVPTSIVAEFYDTRGADRLRKMFYKHLKEVKELGGYDAAWDKILTPEEKAAFQPHRRSQ